MTTYCQFVDEGAEVARLAGKVGIVTGSGSSPSETGAGIGQAIATVLAREGASVLVMDKDRERGEATRRSVADLPGRAEVFVGDVTDITGVVLPVDGGATMTTPGSARRADLRDHASTI